MKDILTESEAERRWCPMGRIVSTVDKVTFVANRVDGGLPLCLASKCMAWRLAHKPSASGEETGFCGAFGVPRHT